MSHQRPQASQLRSDQGPPSSGTGTNSDRPTVIVETLEYRRFAEFCDACRRYGYIGLCYGTPGVGKTLSARRYANWGKVEMYWNHQCRTKALLKEISKGTAAFYTSPVVGSPGHLERDISKSRSLLHNAGIERARWYEAARTKRLFHRAEALRDPKRNPDGYRSAEAFDVENAFHDQRNRSLQVTSAVPDPTALLIIDEADRLKEVGLEQVRSIFDHGGIGSGADRDAGHRKAPRGVVTASNRKPPLT